MKCLQAVLKPSYMISIKAVGTVIPSTFFDALEEFIKHDHLLLRRRIWWQKSTHRAKYCIWLLGEMRNGASTPMAGGPVETIIWLQIHPVLLPALWCWVQESQATFLLCQSALRSGCYQWGTIVESEQLREEVWGRVGGTGCHMSGPVCLHLPRCFSPRQQQYFPHNSSQMQFSVFPIHVNSHLP